MTARSEVGPSDALIVIAAGLLAGALTIVGAETTPLYSVVVLAVLGVGTLALLRPIWAIYLLLVLIPVESISVAAGRGVGLTPAEFVIVAAAGGWLLRRSIEGGASLRSPVTVPVIVLLAVHIPGLFLAVDRFAVFKQLFMWSAMFILFLAILSDEDRDTIKRLAGFIAASGALVAAIAVAKSAGSGQLALDSGGIVTDRATGSFTSPVLLGTFLMITVPMQVVFALRGRTPQIRLAGLAAVLVSLSAMALALSRSASVALTAALLCMCIWWRPARRAGLVAGVILAVLLVTKINPAPGVIKPDVIAERIATITSPDTKTAQDRLRIWRKAPEIIGDSPVFGIGPKNLPVRAAEYDLIFTVGAPSNAHNTPLVVATELGIAGVIVAIWLAIAVGRMLVGALRFAGEPEHAFAIGLAVTFVALAVDGITGYSYTANPFAVVVFLLGALAARIERAATASPPVEEPEPATEPQAEPALA